MTGFQVIEDEHDPGDMMYLGGYYYEIKRFDLALKYYEMAATYDYDPAYEGLAYIWYYGRTGERDFKKAFEYFSKLMDKGDPVSTYKDRAGDSSLTYIDIVEKKGKYYHPFGNKWPKEAPNYIAFRYYGQLQSIHHIESYVITKNIHNEISEMPDEEWNDAHFVYTLGPAIKPNKTVKAGEKVRMAARVWAMLDLLLTEDTVSKAMELSKQRMNS